MSHVWKRKWFAVPIAAIIVLGAGAVGAVAVAGPGGGGSEIALAEPVAGTTVQANGEAAVGETRGLNRIERRWAALHERLERIKQRWLDARARMTPADQAAFDQLQEKAEVQREALREAREDLAETLKEMRALVKKYLPATTTTSTP
jgi:hypothetical protein